MSTIEYLFKVAFKLYYEGGSVEDACNAYPYSPHTYYPDFDQKLMKTIDTAILYMTKNNLGFSSSTLATNKQQALRIVGMIMHTIGVLMHMMLEFRWEHVQKKSPKIF